MEQRKAKIDWDSPAARAAAEFGIDLSMIAENLKLTPAQRLDKYLKFRKSVHWLKRSVGR